MVSITHIPSKPGCNICAIFIEENFQALMTRTDFEEFIDSYHAFNHPRDFIQRVEEKTPVWRVQQVPDMETPFLLHKGVVVGRLYGGCPIKEMLEKLNA